MVVFSHGINAQTSDVSRQQTSESDKLETNQRNCSLLLTTLRLGTYYEKKNSHKYNTTPTTNGLLARAMISAHWPVPCCEHRDKQVGTSTRGQKLDKLDNLFFAPGLPSFDRQPSLTTNLSSNQDSARHDATRFCHRTFCRDKMISTCPDICSDRLRPSKISSMLGYTATQKIDQH